MSEIQTALKQKYFDKNSIIFQHGQNYLQTANDAYTFLQDHPDNCYPIMTLLGFSIELFFKSFDITDTTEKNSYDGLTIHGQPQVQTNNKNGHNLIKLFEDLSKHNYDLHRYLLEEYFKAYKNNLSDVLVQNQNIFPHTRYLYENSSHKKYLKNFNTLYNLTNFLYMCINDLINESTDAQN